MSLRKLTPNEPGYVPPPCRHAEHDPPMHIVLEPGTWEHTCPGCGRKLVFTVGGVTWTA